MFVSLQLDIVEKCVLIKDDTSWLLHKKVWPSQVCLYIAHLSMEMVKGMPMLE